MGVLNLFKMADCGPAKFFKMADIFITEALYKPGTVHEEGNWNFSKISWFRDFMSNFGETDSAMAPEWLSEKIQTFTI